MTGADPFLKLNLDPKMVLPKKGFVSETRLQSCRKERSMKPALIILAALLLAPLGVQGRAYEFPSLGKSQVGNFQPLEMNGEIK